MSVISKIKLPNGEVYEIYDKSAIHDLSDIESLGLEGAFVFKGVVAKESDLPTGDIVKVGHVYHVTENGSEYVYTESGWEEFGAHIVIDHSHTFSGSAAAQTWTQNSGEAAAQVWSQKSGTIEGTGSVSIPTVSKSSNYVKASTSNDDFVKSYPGVTSKMSQVSITPAGTATSVVNSITAPTTSITGVSGSDTASFATKGEAVAVAKTGTAVDVANGLTGGSVASWEASVEDGVLEFNWTANTLQTASMTSVVPAVSGGSIDTYTFKNVTVPKAATSATTVVTGVSNGTTSVATVGTAVQVATGALATNGTGASVLTGLGSPSTAKAITSASVVAGSSADGIATGDSVTIGSENKTVNISGSATVTGENKASAVVVTGTNAASVVTGTISEPVND